MTQAIHRSRNAIVIVAVLAVAATAAAQKRVPLRETVDRSVSFLEEQLVETADAMPAEKYAFVPSTGQFKGVRTFAQQVKHLAATNYILAAAILEQAPPADAGNETGPDSVRTKAEILTYLKGSFAALHKAAAAIDDQNAIIKPSPISPLGDKTTRLGLAQEALIHIYDHYGQMVIYLRLNGIVPPSSR
jgi:uncharacterized damage-inducible protein DinB